MTLLDSRARIPNHRVPVPCRSTLGSSGPLDDAAQFRRHLFSVKFDNDLGNRVRVIRCTRGLERRNTSRLSSRLVMQRLSRHNTEDACPPSLESGRRLRSTRSRYPDLARSSIRFGTAQILLSPVRVSGNGPKFSTVHCLPWLCGQLRWRDFDVQQVRGNQECWWPSGRRRWSSPTSLRNMIYTESSGNDDGHTHSLMPCVHRLAHERAPGHSFAPTGILIRPSHPTTIAIRVFFDGFLR